MMQQLVPGPGGLWVTFGSGVYCSPGTDAPARLVYQHDARVTTLAVAPDGSCVASGDMRGEIIVYGVRERRFIGVMRAWEGWVADLVWDLETEVLVSHCVALDGSVTTEHWRLPGESMALLLNCEGGAKSLWAPDHHAVARLDEGGKPTVWFVREGSGMTSQVRNRHASDLAWSPDSQMLALTYSGQIEVWEAATGEVWWQGQTQGSITGVAWADGTTLVTAETPNNSLLRLESAWLRPWRLGAAGNLEPGRAVRLMEAPAEGRAS